MALLTKAIKGTKDVLPAESYKNQYIEATDTTKYINQDIILNLAENNKNPGQSRLIISK